MIDVRTVIINYITTNLVCASVMTLLWLQNCKRFAGIGFWLGNYVAICLGFILVALRGVVPDFLSIVIANALIVYGILLLYMGVERFVGQGSSQIHNYILLAVFILIHAYFTYLHPSLLARNINVSIGMSIFAFQIAWFIFRRLDTATAFNLRGLGVIAIVFCLVSIAHIVMDLIVSPGDDFLKTDSDSIVILIYQILQIAIAMTLFLQINRGLVVDLGRYIVEHKRAEEAVRASEALYRQMFIRHSAIKLVIEPESGSIVEANLAAVKFYGYPADVLQQMNMRQINVQPVQDMAKLRHEIQEGKVNYFSASHRLASGEIREVEVNSAPIDVNGHTLLYSIIHDITERKQAEEALKESESRYRAVTQSASDAIISSNDDGNIVGWNQSAELIFGYSETEVIDQPLTILMPSHFREEHLAGIARVKNGGEKHIIGKTVEEQGLRKDGSEFPLEMSLSEWQVDDGRFYTAIIRDITERKQAKEELYRAKESLERVNSELQTALIREQQLARTDPLTGVNNRRHLFELTERALKVATRYQQPLSVIMFDIDHFKRVNDVFGHAVGDRILLGVAQTACAELRSADVIGRYGGEEFVIVLPMTNAQQAYPLAERIREGVAALRVPTEEGCATVTLSIGIAKMLHGTQVESAENIIHHADEAMYAAKRAGRNCTVISE